MKNPPNFYASKMESSGYTMWRFATRAQRDEWVAHSHLRRPVAGGNVERAFRAKGVFWRWAKPEFCRPVTQ